MMVSNGRVMPSLLRKTCVLGEVEAEVAIVVRDVVVVAVIAVAGVVRDVAMTVVVLVEATTTKKVVKVVVVNEKVTAQEEAEVRKGVAEAQARKGKIKKPIPRSQMGM